MRRTSILRALAYTASFAALGGCWSLSHTNDDTPVLPGGGTGTTEPPYGAIVKAEVAPPPISGGTLLALHDGTTVVASDPDRDRVHVANIGTNKLIGALQLNTGDEPGRLVEDDGGKVHVVLRGGHAVVTLDPANAQQVDRQDVCPSPRGIAWRAATQELLVACVNGQLWRLKSGTAPTSVYLDSDLRDVVVTSAGTVFVTRFRSAEVLQLDENLMIARRVALPGFHSPRVRSDEPFSPMVAWRAVAVPGKDAILVAHERGQTSLVGQFASPGYYVNGGGGGPNGANAIVHSTVTYVEAGKDAGVSPVVTMATLPVDVAIAADGERVMVAAAGNVTQRLSQYIGHAFSLKVSDMSALTDTIGLPLNTSQGQVVGLTYSTTGDAIFQTREPAAIVHGGVSITLADDSRADTGHLIFHAAPGINQALACASCHPEGGDDGHTWIFAEGTRRTPSIRGGLMQRAPYHWDGSEKTFTDLCDDVFTKRMSGPNLDAGEADALLSWADRIPQLPPQGTADAGAVARGAQLFQSLDCARCHADGGSQRFADVGTGGTFKAPSLKAVAWRTPLLHTGCATTLADRFDPGCGGSGDGHNATQNLEKAQLDDLVAYLTSL